MLPLALVQAGVAGEKQKVNPDGDVEIVLRYSVEVLDPLNPKHSYLECIVRNKSKQTIQVPTSYGGGFNASMSLQSTERWILRLIRWGAAKPGKKEDLKPLAPGKEMTVFKNYLNDLFLLNMERDKPLKPNERRWYWTWQA